MMDSNKASMYENGYENGYSDGFRTMLEIAKEKLDECVCSGEYQSGEDYKYIPYEYYEEVMKGLMEW